MRFRPSPTLIALLILAGLVLLATGPVSPTSSAPTPAASAAPSTSTTTPVPPTSEPTTTPPAVPTSATPTAATPTRACVQGLPVRFQMRSLGVDAPVEQIGLDPTAAPDASGKQPLGSPKDRTKAGWYSLGPAPGSGQGTILTNGHTYRNGSAIFKEDFSRRIAVGQRIAITVDNGSTCVYSVQRVWREVDADREYPQLVTTQRLYDFAGPERLFLVTCSGSWNAASQDYDSVSMLIATPVN